ncbi:Swt1 family HEPN domain-containing protein [Miniimonas sp. S16]|uniref:Swt1 family HEPN domain-containing protein n=1 Tax=Miniimonas sp. S16 TaxID=2171623 RepID=UPI000D5271DC|nr:Swt1 family HEPN domain-containing protein [Miniimonas sp. S16]
MGRHSADATEPAVAATSAYAHAAYGRALHDLTAELAPWVDEQLTVTFPGRDWKAALGARDAAKTGHEVPVDLGDPRRLMRILRDDYRAFTPRLTRTQAAYAHLVLDLTNSWAHATAMDGHTARRGIEYMVDLLLSLSRPDAAERLQVLADGVDGGRPTIARAEEAHPATDGTRDAEPDDASIAERADVDSGAGMESAVRVGNDSTEYVPAATEPRQHSWLLNQLDDPASVEVVRGEIADVIAAEAPILLDRLLAVVVYRFGLQQAHDKRRRSIEPFVPAHLIRVSANRDRVVWPEGEGPEGYTSYRIPPPGRRRPVADIPYEELRNAMVEICWEQPDGVSPGQLAYLVNAEFGGQRVKGPTGDRLQGVIDAALREGTLHRRDGAIVATTTEV